MNLGIENYGDVLMSFLCSAELRLTVEVGLRTGEEPDLYLVAQVLDLGTRWMVTTGQMLLGVIIRRMLRICVALLFFLLLPMPNCHVPDGEKHTLLISLFRPTERAKAM